ncbi:hypothetical protein [Yinghuangia soli]|uniref:Uncharacterized protein n=1 Tax=Yinghuangia soli TaxID=2908204 RepID=A0AA41Q9D4_9ACTN|nr:hypothetical protein [Yinghuangia soli]MCF2533989.1 hypothetical protein [Yinghuangia soli]
MFELEESPNIGRRPELGALAAWEVRVAAANDGWPALDLCAWWAVRMAIWSRAHQSGVVPDDDGEAHLVVVLAALAMYDAAYRSGSERPDQVPLANAVAGLSTDATARTLAGRTVVGDGNRGRLRRADRAFLDMVLLDEDNVTWEMLRLGAVELLRAHALHSVEEGLHADAAVVAPRDRGWFGNHGLTPDWYGRGFR